MEIKWVNFLGTYLFSCPQISGKIIAQNKVLIIRVSEKVALSNWFVFMVEKLESILV